MTHYSDEKNSEFRDVCNQCRFLVMFQGFEEVIEPFVKLVPTKIIQNSGLTDLWIALNYDPEHLA